MGQPIPIPLFTPVYKNAEGSVLTSDAELQYNGFIDQKDGLNIRPGETVAYNPGRQMGGLFYWPDKDIFVSVSNDTVEILIESGTTLSVIGGTASGNLVSGYGKPIAFASDGTRVFLANGGVIHDVTTLGVLTPLADTDAPQYVTHLAFLDGYILAINDGERGDGKFYNSVVTDGESWSALGFQSAEGSPDNLQSLQVVQRQIYLLGTDSTEIWENDGVTPFSRIPGGLIEIGCLARYSPVKRGNSLIWLSHTKQFVEFTGTAVKFLSSRYDKELAEFTNVRDCIGGYLLHGGQEYCLFHFPTEDRTLVYNPALEDWCEWMVWDSLRSEWGAYDFRCSARDLNSGQTFVGKGSAQIIAALDSDSRVDFSSSAVSAPFKFLRRTGWIDFGTSNQKRIEAVQFRAKRGTAFDPSTTPKLMMRYRNDGKTLWSNEKEISLGATGETNHHIRLKRLGVCRSRQFEISATDDVPIVLSNAEADITVLR
jgi:hypothetical protein